MGRVQVTVLIDTFNYGSYLPRAIESVLQQTLPQADWELVVVDDGSTDDTQGRVAAYGEKVRYIRKQNGGQASAFNVGIAESRGEIISFLDADDYFYPAKLEKVVERFTRDSSVGLIYNRYDLVDDAGKILHAGMPSAMHEGDISGRLLLGYVSGCPSSGISVRRNIVRHVKIPEETFRISADHFYLHILPLLTRVAFLPQALHAYRVHDRNLYLRHPGKKRDQTYLKQQEEIWRYARETLGKEFFRIERALEDGGSLSRSQALNACLSGLCYIWNVDAPLNLRARTVSKLMAKLAVPPGAYKAMRSVRNYLTRKHELEFSGL